ncbi:hypothetical protein BJY04DRAFT_180474 [Aspergillus karnatakaensis]|uniref:F-box domain protein n=1 Tax=Aspergillus karnatakaensis TaxID=1810916 RepID=UPI003CCE1D6B
MQDFRGKEPPKPSPKAEARMANSHNPTDNFRLLPLELRQMIAILLTTHDFLNLRYASRAMALVFHDNTFWKSRFQNGGDRSFFEYFLQESITAEQVDWRLVYHASFVLEYKSDITIRVWEVLQWMQETLRAEEDCQTPPLEFYGRALQYYHSDTGGVKRRVERVQLPPALEKVGISIVLNAENVRRRTKRVTEIVAMEFIGQDGTAVMLGSKNPGAETLSSLELETKFAESRTCPFKFPGVHIMYKAQKLSGFRVRYTADGISSVGILQKRGRDGAGTSCKRIFGFDVCDHSTLDMGMDHIVEVVGTFESQRLVDLGLRGFRIRQPAYGSAPHPRRDHVNFERYGPNVRPPKKARNRWTGYFGY